jgi:uncharacterized protein YkwD
MSALRKTALKRTLPRTLVATLVAGSGVTAATPAVASAANSPHMDARERNVIHRINLIRRDHGLSALNATGSLTRAADRHSRRLLRSRTLTHQLPGEASVANRLASAARHKKVGETVFFASRGGGSASIVRAWMDSPPHRAVLLSGDFSKAGVGIRAGRGGVYVTADVAGS